MPQRRILVTGGAGFIGVPTVEWLVHKGEEVVVVDNFEVGERSRLDHLRNESGLAVVELDLRDRVMVERVIHEIAPTHVIHLAAHDLRPFCVAHPSETIQVNVAGTQHLLDALVPVEPNRIVFASTADLYQPAPHPHVEIDTVEPDNVLSASKHMGEQLMEYHYRRCSETDVVVARLFNVVGPGDTNPRLLPDILDHLRESDVLALGDIDTRRDFIYSGDVARAFAMFLDGPEGCFTTNLGSGRSWTAREIVLKLGDLLGRELTIEVDPARLRDVDRRFVEASIRRLNMLLPNFETIGLDPMLEATLIGEGFAIADPIQL
jgi:UDP-glucose 4-epimerase